MLAAGYLRENSRIKQDTIMGIVFSGMFGLGIVLYTIVETGAPAPTIVLLMTISFVAAFFWSSAGRKTEVIRPSGVD